MELIKICCFIGHRKIIITEILIKRLKNLIDDLIKNNGVKIFLFGSKSQFDDLCYSIVTEYKQKYPEIKRIKYTCRSESVTLESEREILEQKYSKVLNKKVKLSGFEEECEHTTKWVSGKASYIERNHAMIDNSDYCIFYYDESYKPPMKKYSKRDVFEYQPKSGTKLAFDYAKQKKKNIFNLFT